MQTKLSSLYESGINIVIGLVVGFCSQLLVFPLFDIHVPLVANAWISLYFMIISLIRSYAIRRWFNAKLHNMAIKLAGD